MPARHVIKRYWFFFMCDKLILKPRNKVLIKQFFNQFVSQCPTKSKIFFARFFLCLKIACLFHFQNDHSFNYSYFVRKRFLRPFSCCKRKCHVIYIINSIMGGLHANSREESFVGKYSMVNTKKDARRHL